MTPLRGRTRVALGLTAAIPVLGFVAGRDATLLGYTLFIVVLLNRERVAAAFARVPLPKSMRFAGAVILSGWLTETCAWLGSYLRHTRHPALFHPVLLVDLLLAVGFYGGWALAWLLVLRRWRFTLGQVFVITGIFGIFIEQDGAVFAAIIASLANPLLAAILAIYVFAVYGAAMGLPYLLNERALPGDGQRTGWLKYPAILVGMYVGGKVVFLIVAVLATALHLIPPKGDYATFAFIVHPPAML